MLVYECLNREYSIFSHINVIDCEKNVSLYGKQVSNVKNM